MKKLIAWKTIKDAGMYNEWRGDDDENGETDMGDGHEGQVSVSLYHASLQCLNPTWTFIHIGAFKWRTALSTGASVIGIFGVRVRDSFERKIEENGDVCMIHVHVQILLLPKVDVLVISVSRYSPNESDLPQLKSL